MRPVQYHVMNLRSHGIGTDEAQEALYGGWNCRRKDGKNYEVLGRTEEGRYLQLVVEVTSEAIRIFHGRDMTPTERARYSRK